MTAPAPPLFCTFITLSKKAMLPRWHSTILPDQVASVAVHRPPSATAPVALAQAAFCKALPSHVVAPTVSRLFALKGTVESTEAPGAANSTCEFFCEKLVMTLLRSSAPTEITEEYDAG